MEEFEPSPEESPNVSMEELLPAAEEAAPPTSIADTQLKAVLEALVYVSEEPLTAPQIAAALSQPTEKIRELLDQLIADFEQPQHGVTSGRWPAATRWPQRRNTTKPSAAS